MLSSAVDGGSPADAAGAREPENRDRVAADVDRQLHDVRELVAGQDPAVEAGDLVRAAAPAVAAPRAAAVAAARPVAVVAAVAAARPVAVVAAVAAARPVGRRGTAPGAGAVVPVGAPLAVLTGVLVGLLDLLGLVRAVPADHRTPRAGRVVVVRAAAGARVVVIVIVRRRGPVSAAAAEAAATVDRTRA